MARAILEQSFFVKRGRKEFLDLSSVLIGAPLRLPYSPPVALSKNDPNEEKNDFWETLLSCCLFRFLFSVLKVAEDKFGSFGERNTSFIS